MYTLFKRTVEHKIKDKGYNLHSFKYRRKIRLNEELIEMKNLDLENLNQQNTSSVDSRKFIPGQEATEIRE